MLPPLDPALKIAVVIPAYQAERQIAGVLRSIPKWVSHIIVVDDGSTDQTYQNAAAVEDSRIQITAHPRNRGVGAAMVTGYRLAEKTSCDIFVKMDGDGQMSAEDLPKILEPLLRGRADYAKGNRFVDWRALDSMPPVRRFGNAWLSFLTKLVSGYWNIFDVTNGFTAITRTAWQRIDPRPLANGYYFETSLLVELNIARVRVSDVELPARYGNETSHLRIHRVALKFPFLLCRSLLRRLYHRYFLRDFNALSLCLLTGVPLLGFGLLYGAGLWLFPPHRGAPTPAGTVMLAALPIILGFELTLAALILDVVFSPKSGPQSASD